MFEGALYVFDCDCVRPKKSKEKVRCLFVATYRRVDSLVGIWCETYDVSRHENFVMRVAHLWIISDFPTYPMLSR